MPPVSAPPPPVSSSSSPMDGGPGGEMSSQGCPAGELTNGWSHVDMDAGGYFQPPYHEDADGAPMYFEYYPENDGFGGYSAYPVDIPYGMEYGQAVRLASNVPVGSVPVVPPAHLGFHFFDANSYRQMMLSAQVPPFAPPNMPPPNHYGPPPQSLSPVTPASSAATTPSTNGPSNSPGSSASPGGYYAHDSSPPPASHGYHKDPRTQKQHEKLRHKLEQRKQQGPSAHAHRVNHVDNNMSAPKQLLNNNTTPSSMAAGEGAQRASPPLSPKKGSDTTTPARGSSDEEEEGGSRDSEAKLIEEVLSNIEPAKVSSVTAKEAFVTWDSPMVPAHLGDRAPSIDMSRVTFDVLASYKGPGGRLKKIYSSPSHETMLQLLELKPFTEYHICIQAKLDEYIGQKSPPVTFKTKPNIPDKPTVPKVISREKNVLQIRWSPPYDQGSKIRRYIVEMAQMPPAPSAPAGKAEGVAPPPVVDWRQVYSGSGKQARIPRLTPASKYLLRLAAVNDVGQSEWSNSLHASTSATAPPVPPLPKLVDRTATSLTLSWESDGSESPPPPNGQLSYTLQMEEAGASIGYLSVYVGNDRHCLVSRLKRNTVHRFRVKATNDEGSSQWSEPVAFTTLALPPGPPGAPKVKGKVTARHVRLCWDAPADDGGAPITAYTLQICSEAETYKDVYNGPDQEFLVESLLPGTAYTFRVFAHSASTTHSPPSHSFTLSTLPVTPGKPDPPKGKAKGTTMLLKWAPPEIDGGSPVTEYEVALTAPDNTTRVVYKGRETECVAASLLPGRPYLAEVRAGNRAGCGPWSNPVELLSGAGCPDAPRMPRVDVLDAKSVSVSWDSPLNNGATVTEYRLEKKEPNRESSEWSTAVHVESPHAELRGLLPTRTYWLRVLAYNSVGASSPSPHASFTMPPGPPDAPTGLTAASVTPTSALLSWSIPPDNGSPIQTYALEMTSAEDGDVLLEDLVDNEVEVNGLMPEASYRFRVQARNSVGISSFSCPPLKLLLPPLPPLPPSSCACVSVGHSSLRLKWESVRESSASSSSSPSSSPNASNSITYVLEMEKKPGSWVRVHCGPTTSAKVHRLQESTTYRFRLSAQNASGEGEHSGPFEFTTAKAPPPTPKNPTVRLSEAGDRCAVEWGAVKLPPHASQDTVIYQLQLTPDDRKTSSTVYEGPKTSFTVDGLERGSGYHVRVCAVRCVASSGERLASAFSSAVHFAPPLVPRDVDSVSPVKSTDVSSRALTEQQYAGLIILGFTVLALVLAALAQNFL